MNYAITGPSGKAIEKQCRYFSIYHTTQRWYCHARGL